MEFGDEQHEAKGDAHDIAAITLILIFQQSIKKHQETGSDHPCDAFVTAEDHDEVSGENLHKDIEGV